MNRLGVIPLGTHHLTSRSKMDKCSGSYALVFGEEVEYSRALIKY